METLSWILALNVFSAGEQRLDVYLSPLEDRATFLLALMSKISLSRQVSGQNDSFLLFVKHVVSNRADQLQPTWSPRIERWERTQTWVTHFYLLNLGHVEITIEVPNVNLKPKKEAYHRKTKGTTDSSYY